MMISQAASAHRARRRCELRLLLKTAPAQYGPALSGLEWNSGFGPAFRTNRAGLGPNLLIATHAFGLALLAALGIVLELFVVEKNLLSCGEDKLSAAVDTCEDAIGKFHGRLPRSKDSSRNRPCTAGSPVPVPCFRS